MTLAERYGRILDQRDGLVDNLLHLPFLRERARGNVLEIGVSRGNSTTALLMGVKENGGTLYSVDINNDCSNLFNDPQWKFIWGDSVNMWKYVSEVLPDKIDVAYIDGDHAYESVKRDLDNILPRMSGHGVIMLHDVLHPDYPGVLKAFGPKQAYMSYGYQEIREGSWGLGVIRIGEKP